jgi:hypothetical protein
VKIVNGFILFCGVAFASHLIQAQAQTPGVFYVSSFTASGTHTDYDMARQAADAYAQANPWTGSVLFLKAAVNQTCDALPLPSLGTSGGMRGTTSIIGYGSGVSTIVKSASCGPTAATLSHADSPAGQLSSGMFQGFTVDANHIDLAACEMYGMSLSTFIDVACGNAVAGADHELEFGNRDPNSVGWMDNIYIYGLKTFDSVVGGKGAVLMPVWTGNALTSVKVSNRGTQKYTVNFTRAQIVGPDLYSCSSIPTLVPILDAGLLISGARITSSGNCTSTAHLYVLIQDGTPVTYGMKFSNMADSHVWNLQPSSTTTYGEGWLLGSNNNLIYNEHPSSNQLVQITDNANGNKHINPVFNSPGEYGAAIYSQNGTFQNAVFRWDSNSYVGASGYYLGNDPRVYQDWAVQNSTCGSVTANFVPITNDRGPITGGNPLPPGVKPQNIQTCDGTNAIQWAIINP